MNRDGLQQILDEAQAIAAGSSDTRPWHIVLLMGLGAWIAAVPILLLIGLLIEYLNAGHGSNATVAALLVAASVVLLRRKTVPMLLEQAAFPLLLSAGGVLGFSLFMLMDHRLAALLMAALAVLLAGLVPQAWVRTILGGICAAMLVPALVPSESELGKHGDVWWFALHAVAALWMAGRQFARAPSLGTIAEPFLSGWLVFTLGGFAVWAGPALLSPAALMVHGTGAARALQPLTCAVSLACTAAAAAILARALPAVRQWWCLGVALVVAGFTFFVPAMGMPLLLLAACVADGRYRLALACGIAAAWGVGSAYYDLSLPLAHKAGLFAMAGALLLAFCLVPLRRVKRQAAAPQTPLRSGLVHAGLALSGLAALAIANAVVVRNEGLIASGQVAFVELGPRDPRSLMQGDYMRLFVRLPAGEQPSENSRATYAVGRLGPDHVLELVGYKHDAAPPGDGTIQVRLENKDGRWMLASDGWFFKEGEAKRYEKARYGEYRIAPSGRALLVGLRGPKLEPL
ncbi:Uncharacterized membrane-anchored protein [Duganella sp. CF458]|uniref:GDYXXLXY domain-containing protein n=1 Tax=Duganella sp. CF458 TaxID=1884368 RepID=UPI0008E84208|nr:GDYXXLXY domain-containing protein [Duganella sp. CF458]SFG46187.1 Uncharacterized membrane-anchored protein [Duganella sp. CF458]